MLKRLWRRWRKWCERRQQVWPVPRPEEAQLRQQARAKYYLAREREARAGYRAECALHRSPSLYACVNGDAALFMGPAHYEALDYLTKGTKR